MIKNVDAILPFNYHAMERVVLIGPHVNSTKKMLGDYYGKPPSFVSPLQGIESVVTENSVVVGVKGSDINETLEGGEAAACAAVKMGATHVIFVVGIDQSIESEGRDRTSLLLPLAQRSLIASTLKCIDSKAKVVMMVLSGGQLDLSEYLTNDCRISSILWLGYPGPYGGEAAAGVVVGRTSPSGRLPFTAYRESFVSEASMFDMNMRPNTTTNYPGRTFRFYTGTPAVKFGTGYSFTAFTFQWSDVKEELVDIRMVQKRLWLAEQGLIPSILLDEAVTMTVVECNVTNVGKALSSVVVLLMIEPPDAGKDGNPLKMLADFTRLLDMKPRESRVVQFALYARSFVVADAAGRYAAVAGRHRLSFVDVDGSLINHKNIILK